MKRIGLITFFDGNYGSALQCFATKYYLNKRNIECDVLHEEYQGVSRYINRIKKLMVILGQTIIHPCFLKQYRAVRKSHSNPTISIESKRKIHNFSNTVLKARPCTYRLLEVDHRKYDAFIAGSDQIWNFCNGLVNKLYLLKFAPPEKRIALAPSFGTESLENFVKGQVKKGLKGFKVLSVREKSGQKIIHDLLGAHCECLPDPTVLLSPGEWRELTESGLKYKNKYILAHFIDKPSEETVQQMESAANEYGYEIICFGYHYESMFHESPVRNIDGNPIDYVSMIDGASLVFTDSFHTTSFCIYFQKNFYVFERNYTHKFSQSSRIINLLKRFSCLNRLRKAQDQFVDLGKFQDEDHRLDLDRKQISDYLEAALDIGQDEKSEDFTTELKSDSDCTGCGACIAVCPKDAIHFCSNELGYEIPKIDAEKCINCGLCEKICRQKILRHGTTPSAYIAYNQDGSLREKSASGGIFSALAMDFLKSDGIVYGAGCFFKDGHAEVQHIRVSKPEDLYKVLGSQYVQSNCAKVFSQIKADLLDGKKVLFCGTSCQVDGLYRFLNKSYDRLYTVDLVCHGVPGRKLFDDHLQYYSKKYKAQMIDHAFRIKSDRKIEYKEKFVLKRDGNISSECLMYKDSAFCRMFLVSETYRESCYDCEFATINKPADITLGDYFEAKEDYPELFKTDGALRNICGISSIITHNQKGTELLCQCNSIYKIKVDVEKVQVSHPQLCKPSSYTITRKKLFPIYNKKGYPAIVRYYKRRNALLFIPKFIVHKLFKR